MSAIKLPELPTVRIGDKELSQVWFRAHEVRAYAEQAVREALASQMAKIHEAVAKEYFKAGASRVIQAINSALIPEKDHG
ncbi:hypothetical protein [Achromobacter marplatensis]|uniref:hypothetical protein n=1 Tax=Achromobacter marplatensis TaxID=470868 RepID=UPI000277FF23|nr:hypothetical protein [Achromobacter marplatensis]EJO27474.1 hypothetical protein QWC_31636 [Achromobacter marplatensis]